MKKKLLIILLVIITIPNLKAFTFDEAKDITNDYIKSSDYQRYLINAAKVPFKYDGNISYDTNFVTGGLIIFLFIDCLLSAYAINVFLLRVCVEENLPVEHRAQAEELYHEVYDNEEKAEFIYKYFSNEKMILTYPNLTITLEDGTLKRVAEYYPDIKNCYYRFDVNRNM